MNRNTGVFIWSKSEISSGIYFSSMRYSDGKYILCGSKRTSNATYDGKIVCTNSVTGDVIWQTDTKGLKYPINNNDYVDDLMAMSNV